MGERASYRQAKKDRLPPSVRNDPGPEHTCRVEDRDCGKKVRLAPCASSATSESFVKGGNQASEGSHNAKPPWS
jgi:hypothetical protein